jgi:hypothetical protein
MDESRADEHLLGLIAAENHSGSSVAVRASGIVELNGAENLVPK